MPTSITISDLNTTVNHEPRVLDTRLAKALGFHRPTNIRKLLSLHSEAIKNFGEVAEETYTYRGRNLKRYYLNEKQALYLCTKSNAVKAVEVTIQMVEVFYAYRHGQKQHNPSLSARLEECERLYGEIMTRSIMLKTILERQNMRDMHWHKMALSLSDQIVHVLYGISLHKNMTLN